MSNTINKSEFQRILNLQRRKIIIAYLQLKEIEENISPEIFEYMVETLKSIYSYGDTIADAINIKLKEPDNFIEEEKEVMELERMYNL